MKALLIKKTAYACSYIVCALLMEFILFSALGFGAFPQYYWMNIAALVMLALIIFILPNFTLQAVIILALLLLQTVLAFVNQSLNKYGGNIFSIDMLSLGKEVGGAFNSSFVSYPLLFGMLAVFFLECAVLFILRRYRVKQSFKLGCLTALLTVFCVMQISAASIYNLTIESFANDDINDEYYILKSDLYLYDNLSIKEKAFKKFGTFAFYLKNIENVINKLRPLSEDEQELARKNGLSEVNAFFKEHENQSSETPYTNALSGNNLIMVMIESGEWYGINAEYTPTLWALSQQGISAENFYARNKTNHSEALGILGSYPKESVFSKNIFYKDTVVGNDFSFSLPSVLKSEGYTTSYLHSNFGMFYDRDIILPAYGFENAYFLEDMPGLKGSGLMPGQGKKIKFSDLDSDKALFETNLERIAPNGEEPFFSFITTITMHGGYDDLIRYGDYPFDGENLPEQKLAKKKSDFSKECEVKGMEEYYNVITRQYFDENFAFLYENEEYSNQEIEIMYLRYKRYQAAYMDLDKGMEALIKHLAQTGRLENTAILMYADHSAYFNGLNYSLKNNEKDIYYEPSVYNIPMFLYSGSMPLTIGGGEVFNHAPSRVSAIQSDTVTRFCSTFDIVPTLLDLFGYKYNTGLYHGSSIFSDAEPTIFVSMESGFFNDKYFSMDAQTLIYPQTYAPEEEEYFMGKIKSYLEKQIVFEYMYMYDYFKYADDDGFLAKDKLIIKSS